MTFTSARYVPAIIQGSTILAEWGAGHQPKMAWLQTGTAAAATTLTTYWDATITMRRRSALASIAQSAAPQSTAIRCLRADTGVQVRDGYCSLKMFSCHL